MKEINLGAREDGVKTVFVLFCFFFFVSVSLLE